MLDLDYFQFTEVESVGMIYCSSTTFLFLNKCSVVKKCLTILFLGKNILHTLCKINRRSITIT